MNKSDLIDHVAKEAELTKQAAGQVVEAVLGGITGALANGDEVKLAGFGNFGVSKRAAREGRNPRTGQTVKIEASMAPKFKPAQAMKNAVNS